jgi:tetratricopeptide (TPR) repeat protein
MGEGLESWESLRAQGLAAAEEAYTFIAQDPRKLLGTVDLLKRAHAEQPADHRILQALGAVHYLAGRDAESREWFEKALPYSPQDEETLKMLGIACYRTGDFASGLKYLKQAIEVNPWNAEVYARYAVMAAVFQDLPTAIEAARQGLELAPSLVPLRRDLVTFLEEAGRTREATQERQKLIQIEAAAP